MKRKIQSLVVLIAFCLTSQAQFNFNSTGLQGISITNPTSLDFGPDGRLYVAVQSGEIYAYTINRNGNKNYTVSQTETILLVKQITNHNDDIGSVHSVVKRQITGIQIDGTAINPIIYVSSSDYRIGGGGGGSDKNLDSNSGIISKLTWNGTEWEKIDLIRGLPRSEENHSTNGLQIDTVNNFLYAASGGNTNAGAPSNNFAFLTEYALSACILKIDLNALANLPVKTDPFDGSQYIYDLPTLDDPTRSNLNGISDPNLPGYDGIDINDPFGGNDGLNQAKWIVGGPVQVYASGFRNIFDLVLTQDDKIYTWDNGANQNWGGHPANEGYGSATNNWIPGEPGSTGPGPNDAKVNNKDGLHYVTGKGYYGGHPNPVRANPLGAGLFTHNHINGSGGQNGIWRTAYTGNPATTLPVDWPPVDPSLADPIEGDFQNSGVDDQSLFNITASTNGMAEYRASNFNGLMQGSLLAASFNGNIYLVNRNAQGIINDPSDVSVLATGFGAVPLDVIAQSDSEIFPGTIWAATYGSNAITVFEPQDFSICTAANDFTIDEDQDGYTNGDEIANGTNPCSGASFPEDFDKSLINGFLVSNLNDPDDDDDGLPDSMDFFALDAQNGTDLNLTFDYPLLNGDPGFGLYGLGFTGFMSNGSDDYLNLYKNENNSAVEIIAGGAVGLLSFNNAPAGTPVGAANNLHNGFQFGLNVRNNTLPFQIETALVGPLFQGQPQGNQFQGVYIGTGSQDDFLLFAANANQGNPVLTLWLEQNGQTTRWDFPLSGISTSAELSLLFEINPLSQTLQAKADLGNGPVPIGGVIPFTGFMQSIFNSPQSLAIGVAAGKNTGDANFNATYDFIKTNYIPNTLLGNWHYLNDGTNCQTHGQSGSCAQGRHEAAYVEAGEYFVLLGGREHSSNVNLYNPATDTWTVGNGPGFSLHHFQAVAHEGLIYVLGGMTGNFPNETPLDHIYIYNPLNDQWHQGPEIPANRRRGSAGAVLHDKKFYVVGGIQNGHLSGWVPWLDEFDPATNTWQALGDAPHARDHFHAAVSNGKLYAAGGRKSGFNGTFGGTVPEVDVYDFNSHTWTTLNQNLPTPLAGNSTVILGNELLLIGGEDTARLASNLTQALDLNSYTWRNLDSLNTGRHGSQAIVNNQAVYITAGSPNRGGGNLKSQEVFGFGSALTPNLIPSSPSNLWVANDIDFGVLAVGQNFQQSLWLKNIGANQAILLDSIYQIGTTSGLLLSTTHNSPYHLSPGDSLELIVSGSIAASFIDSFGIASSAANGLQTFTVRGAVDQPESIFINCGGPAYINNNGEEFLADIFFNNGKVFQQSQAIGNTQDDTLYQSERYATNLQYSIPVNSNGLYQVDLHFAEIYAPNFTSGARLFDINLEGQTVTNNLDIFDTIGGNNALIKTYVVAINDGSLEIAMFANQDNAKLSAIAIRPPASSLKFDPNQHHFQSTTVSNVDSTLVQLNNLGGNLAVIDSVHIGGANPQEFTHTINTGLALPAGYSQNITIMFKPLANSPVVRSAQLQVFYNGQSLPAILNLSGEAGCLPSGLVCDDGLANTLNDTTDGQCNCIGVVQNNSAFSLHINAGGAAFTAKDGTVFTADQFFANGQVAGSLQSITGTQDSALYSTERWGKELAYSIPVPQACKYEVTLHFAEIWSGAFTSGSRVFSMSLEDSLVIKDLDLFAQVGANTAHQQTFTIPVTDGVLNISSLASANNAKLAGISVISASSTLPYLSSSNLNFGVVQNGVNDSDFVWLINPDTLSYTVDSLVMNNSNSVLFSWGASPTVVPANDSLALPIIFSSQNANSGLKNGIGKIHLAGLASALSLNLTASIACPLAGTPCDDGDPNTQNDQENGQCHCNGSPVSTAAFNLNINCGGNDYTSAQSGKFYQADNYFTGGRSYPFKGTTANTSDSVLYSTSRWGRNMSYQIPVPKASEYEITLHFSEIQNYAMKSGKRIFDVFAEGKLVLNDYDIFTAAGAGASAHQESFIINVSDGFLNLQTAASSENSLFIAIEVNEVTNSQSEDFSLYLSTGVISFSTLAGGQDSASFYLINGDSTTHSLDSLQWLGGAAHFLQINAGVGDSLPAGDSLLIHAFFTASSQPTPTDSASLFLYIGSDTLQKIFLLETFCPPAGTTCDDGQSTTINDIEDGNCGCAGTPIGSNSAYSLNINCGGPSYQASTGKSFIADQFFIGGKSMNSSSAIANTNDPTLYQQYRMGRNMSYKIPLAQNGNFEVTLHFAELQNYAKKPAKRVFNLWLEGQSSLTNFDVFTAAGGGASAYSQTFMVNVNDFNLEIITSALSENSVLSAIEIVETETNFKKSTNQAIIAQGEDSMSENFSIFPNPYQNGSRLKVQLVATAPATLFIINSSGVLAVKRDLIEGAREQAVDLDLSPGVYLVRVIQGKKSYLKKLMVY